MRVASRAMLLKTQPNPAALSRVISRDPSWPALFWDLIILSKLCRLVQRVSIEQHPALEKQK